MSTAVQKSMPARQTMAMVPMGTRLNNPGIRRVDVADGTIGRGILASSQVLACLLYFHEVEDGKEGKGFYLVTEAEMLKYGLPAQLYYVLLIARLNTDAKGGIMDDTFKVEYLRLRDSSYGDLMTQIEEVDSTSLAFQKEVKGQYTNIKQQPSRKVLADPNHVKVVAKLADLNVESMFKLLKMELGREFHKHQEKLGFGKPGAEAPAKGSFDDNQDEFAPAAQTGAAKTPGPKANSKPMFDESSEFTDTKFEDVATTTGAAEQAGGPSKKVEADEFPDLG